MDIYEKACMAAVIILRKSVNRQIPHKYVEYWGSGEDPEIDNPYRWMFFKAEELSRELYEVETELAPHNWATSVQWFVERMRKDMPNTNIDAKHFHAVNRDEFDEMYGVHINGYFVMKQIVDTLDKDGATDGVLYEFARDTYQLYRLLGELVGIIDELELHE